MADNEYLHIASIMEAAMPHVDIKTQATMDFMSKLLALMGCFQNMKKTSLTACGFDKQKIDVEGLLSAIRPLCSGKELVLIDQILSMFNAKRMFETYNTYMTAMKEMQGFNESGFGDFNSESSEGNASGNMSGFDFSAFYNAFGNNAASDTSDFDNVGFNADSTSDNSFDNVNNDATDRDSSNDTNSTFNSESQSGIGGNNNMLEMLKTMIPPEQRSTFENLSMLLNTKSYDNSKSDQM